MKPLSLAAGLFVLGALLVGYFRHDGREPRAPARAGDPGVTTSGFPHRCDDSCRHRKPARSESHPVANPGLLADLHRAGAGVRRRVELEAGREQEVRILDRRLRADGFVAVGAATPDGGHLYLVFDEDGSRFEGRFAYGDQAEVWILAGDRSGATMESLPVTSVLCANEHEGRRVAGLPPLKLSGPPAANEGEDAPLKSAAAQPVLNSLPGANGVIYLDFDGETVSGTQWNASFTNGVDIVAPGAGFSDAQIRLIWEVISEDYRPFNVNVTTDRSVYNSYRTDRKTMIIFTPNNEWYGAAGGVAYVDIFGNQFFDEPGWVFTDQLLYNNEPHAPWAAEAGAHEAGHVVGLSHDGTGGADYYEGHGSGATSWGPIMGASYQVAVSQWSRGQYSGANNTEDDLAIIASSRNGLGYRVDDHAGSAGSATPMARAGEVVSASGLIERTSDVDMFSVETGGGDLSITASNFATDPNLDLRLRLLDSQGAEVTRAEPGDSLDATLTATVAPGTYYLEVDGVGTGDPVTGWSDYASLGGYTLSGTVPGVDVLRAEILSPVDPGVSLAEGVGLVIEARATGGVASWSVVDAPAHGSVTFSSAGAASTRCTFAVPGLYRLRLQADSGSESVQDELLVSVESPGAAKRYPNRGPAIDPGGDRNIYDLGLVLDPGASDDGIPGAALEFEWAIIAGNATLSASREERPELTFGAPGSVGLRVVVDDGEVSTFAEVELTGRFEQETLVGAGASGRVLVPTDGSVDATWTSPDYDDRSWLAGSQGVGYDAASGPSSRRIYLPLIATDIESAMYNVEAGCYLRLPFEVEQPGRVLRLTLRMQYDDGFVAYLNGVPVASGNAPGGAQWDSRALSDRDDEAALSFQSFNVTVPPGTLVEGTNVLALHGLNSAIARNERRFLLAGELEAVLKESPFLQAVAVVGDPLLQGVGDDPDGDGLDNLTEHAGGTDPDSPGGSTLLTVRPGMEVVLRLPDPVPDDVRYELETKGNLLDGAWEVVASRQGSAPWSGALAGSVVPAGAGFADVVFPVPAEERRFYRLRLTLVTP